MTVYERTKLLYEQAQLPVFQNRCYDSVGEARDCPKGDVRIVENLETGLVGNAAFQPERVVYDAHYQNEQALSGLFQAHLEEVSYLVRSMLGEKNLLEVGCGKGFFLEMLAAEGVEIHGFDPTYEGGNPRIRKEYFGPDLGMRGDGLILRHVLEHIRDPVEFLFRLREANGGGGRIYIEVPCFDWICRNRAWFDIYYEHVNYFRLTDFQRMFGSVLHGGRMFGGQYLAVIADLATLRQPVVDQQDRVAFPGDFAAFLEKDLYSSPQFSVVWGAASKGVIFSILRERAGHPVDRVVDINPAKQGKYLPGTGLRVEAPQDIVDAIPPNSVVYVMNPNYLDEVRAMSNDAFTYVGARHD